MNNTDSSPHTTKKLAPRKLFIWGDQALFVGDLGDVAPHRHHSIQIVFGLAKSFKLLTDTTTADCRAVLLRPDVSHQIEGYGAVILLPSEAQSSRHIIDSYLHDKDFVILNARVFESTIVRLLDAMVLDFPEDHVKELFSGIVDGLLTLPHPQSSMDPRIQLALDIISDLPTKEIPAGDLARAVHLSESRLTHLFKEQVGIPIRRYLLWRRLIAAIDSIPNVDDLTTAAHQAGFADSAHLSRTFRDMFGVAPSEVFKDSQFVQAVFYLQD